MDESRIIHGNALDLPLDDATVDLVITSPPYFALRSYRDGDEHYDGQIGSEATPQEFLEALWAATREMVRVLKPTGSIFVNLGDKYAGSGGHNNLGISNHGQGASTLRGNGKGDVERRKELRDAIRATRRNAPDRYNQNSGGIPAKSLMGLPWRYALGCVDQLGLILRAEVIWSKPNGLPESVTDRVRRSHETWFHLTKSPRYFSAVDEIREAHKYPLTPAEMASRLVGRKKTVVHGSNRGAGRDNGVSVNHEEELADCTGSNPLGKLPGSVWTIATEPLTIPDAVATHYNLPDHFAAFPTEWPRRIILGWSPSGICTACGEGRRPVVEQSEAYRRWRAETGDYNAAARETDGYAADRGKATVKRLPVPVEATILGYACSCTPHTDHPGTGESSGPTYAECVDAGGYPNFGGGNGGGQRLMDRPKVGPWREYHLAGWVAPPTTPATVLDPFCGTGTVPLIARALGRTGIGIDLSTDYCRLAEWRVFHSDDAVRALNRTWQERQGMFF